MLPNLQARLILPSCRIIDLWQLVCQSAPEGVPAPSALSIEIPEIDITAMSLKTREKICFKLFFLLPANVIHYKVQIDTTKA